MFTSLGVVMSVSRGKFARKLKKLKNNPVGFFSDSVLVKAFSRPGTSVKPISVEPKVIAKVLSVDVSNIKAFVDFDLGRNFIKFGEKNKCPAGMSVLLVLPKEFKGASELVGRLWMHEDFLPLRKEYLHIGWFDSADFVSVSYAKDVASVLNRIDQKNKKALNDIDFIFFVDVPDFVVEGFRFSVVSSKVISVSTQNKLQNASAADGYIAPSNLLNFDKGRGRRVVCVDSSGDLDQVAIAMRRIVQDGKPRDKDLLLPVMGDFDVIPDWIDFNSEIYQGIIYAKGLGKIESKPFFDVMISEFSGDVEKIMLIESVYMKYKTLCEGVERGGSPDLLISTCLKDGVLFDVRC